MYFSRNAGSLTTLTISLLSLSTIAFGVPAGANRPYQLRDGGAFVAGLRQQRHVREVAAMRMLFIMTSGVILPARMLPMTLPSPNSAIGVVPLEDGVDRLAAAAERHAHPVGALLLLERLHVEHAAGRRGAR